jgi:hypothetical protein
MKAVIMPRAPPAFVTLVYGNRKYDIRKGQEKPMTKTYTGKECASRQGTECSGQEGEQCDKRDVFPQRTNTVKVQSKLFVSAALNDCIGKTILTA